MPGLAGAEPIKGAIRDVSAELRAGLPGATAEAAQVLADAIAAEAPRRSGKLANSVSAGPDRVTVTAVYARVIAGGWRRHNIKPNPFDQRGVDRATPDAVKAIDDDIQRRLNRA